MYGVYSINQGQEFTHRCSPGRMHAQSLNISRHNNYHSSSQALSYYIILTLFEKHTSVGDHGGSISAILARRSWI